MSKEKKEGLPNQKKGKNFATNDHFESLSEKRDYSEVIFLKSEKMMEIRKCISELKEIEQIVLCMHLGFYYPEFNNEGHVHTLEEIQEALISKGYTDDVKLVHIKAYYKLRHILMSSRR